MKIKQNFNKIFNMSIWAAYILIVFEILYMISPFAFYYYSVYKMPLKLLNSNPLLAFLTGNILPHFTAHDSLFITIINYLCWPLVLIGAILFIISFIQLYYSKLSRKSIVSGGLYRLIRHPQYLSLAVLGLGTTIYWSRFIIFLSYCTMLFLYYFLAKQEESLCMEKYRDSYKKYSEETGMFFPKIIESKFLKFPKLLPKSGWTRILSISVMFVIYLVLIIITGFLIKNYSLSSINTFSSENYTVISVSQMEKTKIKKIYDIALDDNKLKMRLPLFKSEKYLIYIIPSGWNLPELGIIGNDKEGNYWAHSASHGNSSISDISQFIVLITKSVFIDSGSSGEQILKNSTGYIPIVELLIDLNSGKIVSIKEREDRGQWEGIPVPIF